MRVVESQPEQPDGKLVTCYRHVADRYELAAVLSGRPWVGLPSGPVKLSPGDLVFIEKGVEHGELEVDPPEPHTVLWCHFLRNSVMLSQTDYHPQRGWREREQLKLQGRTDVESIATAIAAELVAKEAGWENCARGLLQYLVWIVIRRLQRSPGSGPPPSESPSLRADSRAWDIVRGVLAHCESSPDGKPDLRGIAANMGYHPSYLSRLVSRHLGRSLSQHLHARRMEKAKRLLERLDLSVRDVAAALGYDDPAHFSRAFTRASGVPPSAYRRRLVGS